MALHNMGVYHRTIPRPGFFKVTIFLKAYNIKVLSEVHMLTHLQTRSTPVLPILSEFPAFSKALHRVHCQPLNFVVNSVKTLVG